MSGEKPEKFNQQHYDLLLRNLEGNNKQGYDFLEYRKSLEALKSLDMDEATRYKSAFATGSTMGATVDGLLSSVEHYTNVLRVEKDKFADMLQKSVNEKVISREQEIGQINSDLQSKREMIEQLTAEIAELETRKETITGEVKASSVKIEATKIQFQETFKYMVTEILDTKKKMEEYLS